MLELTLRNDVSERRRDMQMWIQRLIVSARRRVRKIREAHLAASAPFAIMHAPACYARRSGDFTANICGVFGRDTSHLSYALNNGPSIDIRRELPRVGRNEFVIEMAHEQLRPGSNVVEFRNVDKLGRTRCIRHKFSYRPDGVELPCRVTWGDADLDVGDGVWETLARDVQSWLRPKPGHEAYDRTVIVVGAFEGGRRVEVPVIFRHGVPNRPFGFGMHPQWGGRPDDEGRSPRRGWNFSFAGYYSRYSAIGMEFSFRHGASEPVWVGAYRNFALHSDVPYRMLVEVRTERDRAGRHLRFRQRMSFQPVSSAETPVWIELADSQGVPMKEGEYGVALLAHNCQVEFGSVSVNRLPSASVPVDDWAMGSSDSDA